MKLSSRPHYKLLSCLGLIPFLTNLFILENRCFLSVLVMEVKLAIHDRCSYVIALTYGLTWRMVAFKVAIT